MRLALISDIHGNLNALEHVLLDIAKKEVDEILCLGDIVGYGAKPNECVDALREKDILSIKGNHEQMCVDLNYAGCIKDYVTKSIRWTHDNLTDGNKKYLNDLPEKKSFNDLFLVHASPRQPLTEYLQREPSFEENIKLFDENICFFGHVHYPIIYEWNKEEKKGELFSPELIVTSNLDPENKYLINVGSVGQPRDGNAYACYGLFDTETKEFKHIRVGYDIQKTQDEIIEAGLPSVLAERLEKGE